MPVSALVLTVDSQFNPASSAWTDDPRLLLGAPQGRFVPLVSTTSSLREARDLATDISRAPGVLDVQLLSYSDDELADDELAQSDSSDDGGGPK